MSSAGMEDEHGPEHDQRDLGHQVGDREEDVQLRRLAEPADVEQREDRDHDGAADDVPGPVPERREERAR